MSNTIQSLSVNVNAKSSVWLEGSVMPWGPQDKWHNVENHTTETFTNNPTDSNTSPSMGTTVTVKIHNSGQILKGKPLLRFTRGIVATASNASLVPNAAFAFIKQLRWVYNNRIIERYSARRIYFDWLKEHTPQERYKLARMVGAEIKNMDYALADALRSREYMIPLPTPWDADRGLPCQCLPAGLHLEIDLAQVADVARWTGSTAGTISLSNFKVEQEFIMLPKAIADSLFLQGTEGKGWTFKFQSRSYQSNQSIAASATSASIRLPNVANDLSHMDVYIEKNGERTLTTGTDMVTVGTSGNWYNWKFSPFNSYLPYKAELTNGNNLVHDTIAINTGHHQVFRDGELNQDFDLPFFSIAFGADRKHLRKATLRHNTGFRNLTGYQDATLIVYFNPTTMIDIAGVSSAYTLVDRAVIPTPFRSHSLTDGTDATYLHGDYCYSKNGALDTLILTVEGHCHNVMRLDKGYIRAFLEPVSN